MSPTLAETPMPASIPAPLKRFRECWQELRSKATNPSAAEAAMLVNCHSALEEFLTGHNGFSPEEGEVQEADAGAATPVPANPTSARPGFYCLLVGDQTSGKTTLLTRLTRQAAFVVKDGVGTR